MPGCLSACLQWLSFVFSVAAQQRCSTAPVRAACEQRAHPPPPRPRPPPAAAALSRDEAGEPGIYVWSDGSTVSEATLRSGEAGCYASGVPLLAAGGAGHAVQLWSYTASGGWEQRGCVWGLCVMEALCTLAPAMLA